MSPVMTSHPAIANKEILNPYLHLARCPLEYFPGRKRMNTTLPCRATTGSGGCAARGRQHHHTVHKRLLGPHHAKRCCERKVVFMNAAFKCSSRLTGRRSAWKCGQTTSHRPYTISSYMTKARGANLLLASITRGQNYFTRLSLIMNLFSIYKPLLRLADPVIYSM